MTWIVATIITTVLWGSYSIFGEKATSVHGEKVSFIFELIGMIVIACIVFGTLGGFADFKKVTNASAVNAIIMGLMVAAGTFTLLYAMRTAPSINHFPFNQSFPRHNHNRRILSNTNCHTVIFLPRL